MSDKKWPKNFDEALKSLMPSGDASPDALAERRRIASILTAFRNAFVQPCEGCGESHTPEVIRKPTLILLSAVLGCELRNDDTDASVITRMESMLDDLNLDDQDFKIAESIFVTTIDVARQMDMQSLAARAATNHQPATDKMMN